MSSPFVYCPHFSGQQSCAPCYNHANKIIAYYLPDNPNGDTFEVKFENQVMYKLLENVLDIGALISVKRCGKYQKAYVAAVANDMSDFDDNHQFFESRFRRIYSAYLQSVGADIEGRIYLALSAYYHNVYAPFEALHAFIQIATAPKSYVKILDGSTPLLDITDGLWKQKRSSQKLSVKYGLRMDKPSSRKIEDLIPKSSSVIASIPKRQFGIHHSTPSKIGVFKWTEEEEKIFGAKRGFDQPTSSRIKIAKWSDEEDNFGAKRKIDEPTSSRIKVAKWSDEEEMVSARRGIDQPIFSRRIKAAKYSKEGDEVEYGNEKNFTVKGNSVFFGPGKTSIIKKKWDQIRWNSVSSATRSLLRAKFTQAQLANSSLTGKISNAFIGRAEAREQLDTTITEDIIDVVTKTLDKTRSEVKKAITSCLADEHKLFNKKKQSLNASQSTNEDSEYEEISTRIEDVRVPTAKKEKPLEE